MSASAVGQTTAPSSSLENSAAALSRHEHSAYAYAHGFSDCPDCRACEAARVAIWRRSPRRRVPIGQTRAYLKELLAGGMSIRGVAREARVSDRIVRDVLTGRVSRITRETRSRLLGVFLPATDDGCGGNDIPVVSADPLAGIRIAPSPEELAWKRDAECDPSRLRAYGGDAWFFPDRGESVAPARAICARCTVREPCLALGLLLDAPGIWGGTTGEERRAMKARES